MYGVFLNIPYSKLTYDLNMQPMFSPELVQLYSFRIREDNTRQICEDVYSWRDLFGCKAGNWKFVLIALYGLVLIAYHPYIC